MTSIQYLDGSNVWMNAQTIPAGSQFDITWAMNEVKKQYPNSRVRAVNVNTGQLIDMIS